MRPTWLTVLHLNFVTDGEVDALCRAVDQTLCDAVLTSGGMGGSIAEVRDAAKNLKFADARLKWLPAEASWHSPKPRR